MDYDKAVIEDDFIKSCKVPHRNGPRNKARLIVAIAIIILIVVHVSLWIGLH